jgi:membrane-bound lytic murein transglycosylase B
MMRRLFVRFLAIFLLLTLVSCGHHKQASQVDFESPRASYSPPWPEAEFSQLRGWDYLVEKLARDGVPKSELAEIFKDERLPRFTYVPFQMYPRESARMYSTFTQEKVLHIGRDFLAAQRSAFEDAERLFGVNRYVVAAILLIESGCGANTGSEQVLYRLARLASVREPHNLQFNFERLRKLDEGLTPEEVSARAEYLEKTFYPEMLALFELRRREDIDILELKGSSAGAFGISQFLPSSYLSYAVDANKDKQASLFAPEDAVWSTAYYLSAHGWRDEAPVGERLKALWAYNRSEAYGEAVLKVSILLSQPPAPVPVKNTAAGKKAAAKKAAKKLSE